MVFLPLQHSVFEDGVRAIVIATVETYNFSTITPLALSSTQALVTILAGQYSILIQRLHDFFLESKIFQRCIITQTQGEDGTMKYKYTGKAIKKMKANKAADWNCNSAGFCTTFQEPIGPKVNRIIF